MAVGKAIKAAAKATGAGKAKKVAKKAKAGAKKVKGKVSERRAARKKARGARRDARKAAKATRKEGRAKARAIKKGARGKGKAKSGASGVSKAAKAAAASSKKKKASSKPTAGAAKKSKAPLSAAMYGGNKSDYHEHMDQAGHETKTGVVGGGKYGKGGHYKDYEGTGMYGKKGAHMMDQPMMADSNRLKGAGSEGDPGLGRMSMGASMSQMSKHMKGGPLMSKYKVGTGGKKLR